MANRLGITSPATIRNWLEDGYFPGAFHADGQRYFPLADVLGVEERIRQTEAENAAGVLPIPEYGDEDAVGFR